MSLYLFHGLLEAMGVLNRIQVLKMGTKERYFSKAVARKGKSKGEGSPFGHPFRATEAVDQSYPSERT